jgi:hypothetical protein
VGGGGGETPEFTELSCHFLAQICVWYPVHCRRARQRSALLTSKLEISQVLHVSARNCLKVYTRVYIYDVFNNAVAVAQTVACELYAAAY